MLLGLSGYLVIWLQVATIDSRLIRRVESCVQKACRRCTTWSMSLGCQLRTSALKHCRSLPRIRSRSWSVNVTRSSLRPSMSPTCRKVPLNDTSTFYTFQTLWYSFVCLNEFNQIFVPVIFTTVDVVSVFRKQFSQN